MKLLLLGGGGHCRSVIDSIDSKVYDKVAIVDLQENVGKEVMGISIIAAESSLGQLFSSGFCHSIITIGSIGDCSKRKALQKKLFQIGLKFESVIDKTAVISKFAQIGEGTFVGKTAVINAGVIVGNHAIINTKASIDHDSIIGDFVHISPGVTLSGGVKIGNGSHIGTGAIAIQGISVGSGSIVGAGSVIVKDIPDNVIAFGNPCKVIKER